MENTEKLIAIKNEMENVRELYIKGFIKEVYQKETRFLFEMAMNMEHDEKVSNLKESIKNFNNLSSKKKNLIESIEMLWLNASVKKKKRI